MIVKIAVLYLVLVNVLTFIMWGVDKAKAKAEAWRIPEATLLLLALFGGSVGALFGMYGFRHKTQKWQFKLGVPLLLLYHVGLLLMVWFLCKYWGLSL